MYNFNKFVPMNGVRFVVKIIDIYTTTVYNYNINHRNCTFRKNRKEEFIMEKFLRDLFESEMSGAQAGHSVTIKHRNMLTEQSELYDELRSHLSEEDRKLFDRFDSVTGLINEEERFYTFRCGIKLFAKFLKGFFSD